MQSAGHFVFRKIIRFVIEDGASFPYYLSERDNMIRKDKDMFAASCKKRYGVLATALTLDCFRNTVLEDYHASRTPMNMDIYSQMQCITEEQLKVCLPLYWRYFFDLDIRDIKPDEDEHLFLCFAILNIRQATAEWDPPKLLQSPQLDKMPISDYVLGGEFLKACEDGLIITDHEMPRVVHDIHCRYYTLLNQGILNGESSMTREDLYTRYMQQVKSSV